MTCNFSEFHFFFLFWMPRRSFFSSDSAGLRDVSISPAVLEPLSRDIKHIENLIARQNEKVLRNHTMTQREIVPAHHHHHHSTEVSFFLSLSETDKTKSSPFFFDSCCCSAVCCIFIIQQNTLFFLFACFKTFKIC